MIKIWLLSLVSFQLCGISLALAGEIESSECHPAPDRSLPQYVVGYGSLMETASKRRTAPLAGESLPTMITGFQRGWYAQGSITSPTTFLGVILKKDAQMNAVVYRLPLIKELLATDRREGGYCRYPVESTQIEMLDRSVVPQGQIWIYVVPASKITAPNAQFPIVQSYVDIVIGGCLEIAETFELASFAPKCVETTDGWSFNWINDRIYPRRPFIYQPKAGAIDAVLQKVIPEVFKKRKIE